MGEKVDQFVVAVSDKGLSVQCLLETPVRIGRGVRTRQHGVALSLTRLLQLTEFSFKTIKYWSGFADDSCPKT